MSAFPSTTIADALPLLSPCSKPSISSSASCRTCSASFTSPAALEGYLSLSGALAKGTLPPDRERIALAVANQTAATTASRPILPGQNLAKLDDAEIAANRLGHSKRSESRRRSGFRRESCPRTRSCERRPRARRQAGRLRRRPGDRDRLHVG